MYILFSIGYCILVFMYYVGNVTLSAYTTSKFISNPSNVVFRHMWYSLIRSKMSALIIYVHIIII
jgi:hypothetical protein